MVRYALRRALWLLPTLAVITLVAFAWLSLVPSASSADQHLPAFLNPQPRDVRSLAEAAVEQLAYSDDPQHAADRLARLGSAALPFVLPRLDALAPSQRARVALALAPVAQRMGLLGPEGFADGAQAAVFWQRFWEERSIDFKTPVVRRAVRRLVTFGSEARRTELIELDTFALEELIESLGEVHDTNDVQRVARLTDVTAHIAERDDRVFGTTSLAEAQRCASRWRQWWLDAHTDYVVLAGPGRLAAMVLETRYGHWALSASSLRLGTGPSGAPVFDVLKQRGTVTVGLALAGQLLACGIALLAGLLGAWRRTWAWDRLPAALSLGIHALTPALLAALLAALGGWRFAAASCLVAITLSLIAPQMRQVRVAALDALASDPMRAAVARGTPPLRALVAHALPLSVLPLISVASVDFPVAFTAACVAERLLGVDGICSELTEAVQQGNLPLLMAFAVCCAAIATVLLVAADLLSAWLDPRSRHRFIKESR
jgi:ABC-type dipeptide/oligopeptide/nickel transport system permease component